MSTLRRNYKTATQAKRCQVLVPVPASTIPAICGDRVWKAGLCRDHWLDKRHVSETRRGTEAVNSQRRERNGTPLPKDLSRATVAQRVVTPAPEPPEPIDVRRQRQGVAQSTQDWLIDRAALRRARKSGFTLWDPPSRKEMARFRAVRT